MSFEFIRQLPSPEEIKEQYPVPSELAELKNNRDDEIRRIFSGESDKFILIIGPCSADNEDAVLDYVSRLKTVQEKVSDRIMIIPRIYTNKPRTTGQGYKGMLHQPDPSKKPDMLAGLLSIRHMHLRAIKETGLTAADEMLYPDNYRYLSDVLSYVAVGARSVENQQHRLVTSGMDIPCGMKNPTAGNLNVMLNSIIAAQSHHTFLYRGWEVSTTGNPLAHCILRGYVNKHEQCIPNYHYEDLKLLFDLYAEKNLVNPAVIVDTNHSNSNKQHLEQIRIAKDVIHSRSHSDDLKSFVKGLMIESYIESGAQKIGEGIYGKSITDPCIGWSETEKLIYDIAELV